MWNAFIGKVCHGVFLFNGIRNILLLILLIPIERLLLQEEKVRSFQITFNFFNYTLD